MGGKHARLPEDADDPEVGAECENAADDDGDVKVNDGCGQVGDESEAAIAGACDNAVDDDGSDAGEDHAANGGIGFVNDGCPAVGIVVELEPNPLPLSTVRAKVFHDNHSVTGTEDVPVEAGLGGFHITLRDRIGEGTTDS